ncbi:MAG TPA: GNAT family N-acetyltransferase [Polyangiaceae bacterium]|nr:GNAT family N-acetyltransferase [Polyangiaceae bacterium]
MPPGYTIRLSRRTELHRLPEIERRAAQLFAGREAELGLLASHLESVTPLASLEQASDDGRLWVAASDQDEPVGFALVVDLGLFAHLDELDVSPEHGRRGLGGALIEAVCSWATLNGFSAVTLSTFRNVPWNAPAYAKRGFEPIEADDLPPELVRIVEVERKKGLLVDRRVIMQREV